MKPPKFWFEVTTTENAKSLFAMTSLYNIVKAQRLLEQKNIACNFKVGKIKEPKTCQPS